MHGLLGSSPPIVTQLPVGGGGGGGVGPGVGGGEGVGPGVGGGGGVGPGVGGRETVVVMVEVVRGVVAGGTGKQPQPKA